MSKIRFLKDRLYTRVRTLEAAVNIAAHKEDAGGAFEQDDEGFYVVSWEKRKAK